ncbi:MULTISPECIES: 50S ribosomal protein L24 [Moraxella]|jgi:ribosomal protein L24|uniref:Large ribosomal subunit protein uL24 n=4 Tax=Moraxella TaxID=475 RepID=A0A1T0A064_MORBO|nr:MULTISPECIES: 50S ribosomal protein L24 [Moraxella]AWY21410.1 50S ribosomal protein L24 [Moraxella bovis]MBE9578194.1 50S ribosomal protein L24 [Moraxella sp. K1664]MBE9588129.1 50S ribosomal protein L24 [Moraxella sp. K1630]MBE9589795.1 50S ribosomal protein L24 [Moraxella sp. K127]MBE9596245.1 50S ribosomal protein L24 [Moraxella sp. K2450]
MAKLRKGDTVVVIAGKDKGKQGTILAVKADRVKVEGINIVTKHQKPNQMLGKEGGIVKQEAFLHISNVAIYNAATQKADRVAYQVNEEGKKVRIYRSTGEVVATA